MFILPYKNGSQGAKDLAEALNAKQIKREGSKFKGSKDKIVINWGSTTMSEEVAKCEVINKPEAVALASNKLRFFEAVVAYNKTHRTGKISIPKWMTNKEDAREYIFAGHIIVARTVLNGHSGAGIVLCETTEQLDAVDAPLYVVYEPKKQEYRIHVLRGEVVDIQRKARRTETPDDQVNWKIRNHDNGFIYSRNEDMANLHPKILSDSIASVAACGLDFGAVDVIYNEKMGIPYVLEVNTAPGLSGETLAGYARRMKEIGIAPKKSEKITIDELFDMEPNPFEDQPQAQQAVEVVPVGGRRNPWNNPAFAQWGAIQGRPVVPPLVPPRQVRMAGRDEIEREAARVAWRRMMDDFDAGVQLGLR